VEETKKCTCCTENKYLKDFFKYKHQNGREYYKSVCKKCFQEDSKKYQRKWAKKESVRESRNKYRRERGKLPEVKLKKKVSHRKEFEKNIHSYMLHRARKRALNNNIEFNITKEDIVIPEFCPLLEIPIFLGTRENYRNSPSLDRIDITKGYIKGNVGVISMYIF